MSARAWVAVSLAVAFTLAIRLERWRSNWAGTGLRSGNLLAVALGDSRRMFANHVFAKADVYFHSGYYPSIFDNKAAFRTAHISADAGAAASRNAGNEQGFLGPPRDWIERFGRRFIPNAHTHLDTGGADTGGGGHDAPDHEEGHTCSACAREARAGPAATTEEAAAGDAGEAREMLPWLRLSVALDPHRVESYVVAAYWLRERMGRVDVAEQFLREGLIRNPDSCELYFELGRLAWESRQDAERARRLWLRGLASWERVEAAKPEPDLFMKRQLLAYLSEVEEEGGELASALRHLQAAKAAAGGSPLFDERLARLEAKLAGR